jgi:two-component system response regulator PhoP
MKALIVEDDADLRRQLCNLLEQRGYTIEQTGSGREALYLGQISACRRCPVWT